MMRAALLKTQRATKCQIYYPHEETDIIGRKIKGHLSLHLEDLIEYEWKGCTHRCKASSFVHSKVLPYT